MAFLSFPTSLPLRPHSFSSSNLPFFPTSTTLKPRVSRPRQTIHLAIPSSASSTQHQQPHTSPIPVLNPTISPSKSNRFNFPITTLSPSLLFSALLPFLFSPLSALSQDAPDYPTTSSLPTEAIPQSEALTNFLGSAVVFLLIYASVGVIILTVENFRTKRNDERHLAVLDQLIRENPGKKTFFDSFEDVKEVEDLLKAKPSSSSSKSTSLPRPGGNRQFRRIEKKVKDKETRAEKRKQKLADQRAAANTKDSSADSS